MADNEEQLLSTYESSQPLILKRKRWQWWLLVAVNVTFLVVGQSAGVVLERFYYERGGNSAWMTTLAQTAGFPILYIPLFVLPSTKEPSTSPNKPSSIYISLIYFFAGLIMAADYLLYSVGLLYLSASTYSLIIGATQLACNAIFSHFLNSQKITSWILISVILLSLSAVLIATDDGSVGASMVSSWKYTVGFLCTLAASAINSLMLSLSQFFFQNILKTESFSAVLKMLLFISTIATCVSIAGLFTSREWEILQEEMVNFAMGKVAYVMTLVGAAIAWQVFELGVMGLVLVVSSLFSNVVGTVSLAVTPIASLIIFHDQLNALKIISMLLALLGFASYIFQNYLDYSQAKRISSCEGENHGDSSC